MSGEWQRPEEQEEAMGEKMASITGAFLLASDDPLEFRRILPKLVGPLLEKADSLVRVRQAIHAAALCWNLMLLPRDCSTLVLPELGRRLSVRQEEWESALWPVLEELLSEEGSRLGSQLYRVRYQVHKTPGGFRLTLGEALAVETE